MQTFLGKTAAHIWAQHSVEDLKDVAVVMPSQRSVLYLKKELALQSDHQARIVFSQAHHPLLKVDIN